MDLNLDRFLLQPLDFILSFQSELKNNVGPRPFVPILPKFFIERNWSEWLTISVSQERETNKPGLEKSEGSKDFMKNR